MKEVEFGGRFNTESRIGFFGINEINELLAKGYTIISLKPGGALMTKLPGIENGNVRLTLSGFSIRAVLEVPTQEPAL
jgi:hypothetical protein